MFIETLKRLIELLHFLIYLLHFFSNLHNSHNKGRIDLKFSGNVYQYILNVFDQPKNR